MSFGHGSDIAGYANQCSGLFAGATDAGRKGTP
jgi:hypothetical protein